MVNEQLDVWSCGSLDAENIRYYDLVNQVYFETKRMVAANLNIFMIKNITKKIILRWFDIKSESNQDWPRCTVDS